MSQERQQQLIQQQQQRLARAVSRTSGPAATHRPGADIETAYHGADGAELFFERKYDEAISHLEGDITNPLSLKLLATAYQKIGYSVGQSVRLRPLRT